MSFFKKIVQRRHRKHSQPLHMEGVADTPMTPEPDDAELAAQALLETLMGAAEKDDEPPQADKDSSKYYHALSEKIRQAHESARQRALRFVVFCEQELKRDDLPFEGPGSLLLLDTELLKRIDTVEREGGELLKRWQRCVAEVTIRKMQGLGKLTDDEQ